MNQPRKPKRKALTKALERRVILEARGQCPWCEKPTTHGESEIHHIDGDRSNNSFANLLFVCRNHHGQIEAHVIPEWDVNLKKQILCNPSVMERLGLPTAKPVSTPSLVGRDNYGIVAKEVKIETLKMERPRAKSKRNVTPGLIEADVDMRTYANYLVKRYIEWRKRSVPIDGRKFSVGSAHGILAEGFGSPGSVLLIQQTRFSSWVEQAQRKIDRTTFGSINRSKGQRNYHSWAEHLAERHGQS